ncbi:MAG: radical SAM protein [Stygiobacter sp.]|nr:MAG: radical SAM protein [Stygiobacter sp.]
MSDNNFGIRPKESYLTIPVKTGENDAGVKAPVHQIQYNLDTEERERRFVESQYPTEAQRERYYWYRREWHRRAEEMDPGEIPLAVTIELVSTCNLACTMCYTITEEFQNTVVGAQRMLPWPIVKRIIDEAAELNVPSILFSWRGESTLYRWRDGATVITFPDVLKYARQKGILEITSLTHGQLIDEEMAKAIVDAEPSWISFSFDGLFEQYNRIRTPPNVKRDDYDAFRTVVDNIKRLVALRDAAGKKRPQIRSNTIYPAIAKDPKGYRDYLTQLGVDMITVNELLDLRSGEVPDHMLMENWACSYPFQRLTVSANGIVIPCTGAHKEQSGLVLGRYSGSPSKVVRNVDGTPADVETPEMSLREAWFSSKLKNIRELHKAGRRAEIHPGCRHCNHGVKKFGADRLPEEWDLDNMTWVDQERKG